MRKSTALGDSTFSNNEKWELVLFIFPAVGSVYFSGSSGRIEPHLLKVVVAITYIFTGSSLLSHTSFSLTPATWTCFLIYELLISFVTGSAFLGDAILRLVSGIC
jgi:hypothetical protein